MTDHENTPAPLARPDAALLGRMEALAESRNAIGEHFVWLMVDQADLRAAIALIRQQDAALAETRALLDTERRAREGENYQVRVARWMAACFSPSVATDKTERNHRFLEEALELVQSAGCTTSEAHQLVDYVFGRAVGELQQEVGGVLVCLAALCSAHQTDMEQAGEIELARVWTKIDRIRAKHAAKPQFSPLPGALAAPKAETEAGS